jgi:hypothetical protein
MIPAAMALGDVNAKPGIVDTAARSSGSDLAPRNCGKEY